MKVLSILPSFTAMHLPSDSAQYPTTVCARLDGLRAELEEVGGVWQLKALDRKNTPLNVLQRLPEKRDSTGVK
uniref:Uncharacterized protein n=1 Tax=Knipowitschia caucasica TaxID=637954 RepID=A0AAV2KVI7_KNICA